MKIVRKFILGVGKINAALSIKEAIEKHKPKLVINLGTAGGLTLKKGNFVECNMFVQHDMKCQAFGYGKFETPSDPINIIKTTSHFVKSYIVGTGDTTVSSDIGLKGIDLVDMEAYSLAKVCYKENIPFRCFKFITDECNSTSLSDWKENSKLTKQYFENIIDIREKLSENFSYR